MISSILNAGLTMVKDLSGSIYASWFLFIEGSLVLSQDIGTFSRCDLRLPHVGWFYDIEKFSFIQFDRFLNLCGA
jgi:hypothetical protein